MHAALIIALLALAPASGPILASGAVVMIKLTTAITARNAATLRSAHR